MPPIPGGTVCKYHGGRAPQVIKSAKERLAALIDPALAIYEERLKDGDEPGVQWQVARDILDRTGHKGKEVLELSGPNGGAVQFDLSRVSDDELDTILRIAGRARGGG